MPSTTTPAQFPTSARTRAARPSGRMSKPTSASRLLWIGGNIGLGFDSHECYFTIEENGVRSDWTIAATLARIDDFSELARKQIIACCAHQAAMAVLYDVISDQGATLLADVTHAEACSAIDTHQVDQGAQQWQGEVRIRRQR